MMFAVFCERHGSKVLLGSGDVIAMTNGPAGPQLHWECFCGQTGVLASCSSLQSAPQAIRPSMCSKVLRNQQRCAGEQQHQRQQQ